MATIEEKLLTNLNPEQREVVLHDKGPLLVVAVAGAGKTHALVNRVGYLVEVRGVPPAQILAVTFSKKGADEMQDRLDRLIGKSGARIGTFHSLAYEILRNEVPGLNDWTVDDRDRYRLVLKDVTGYKGMDWKEADITVLDRFVATCKCNLARPDSQITLEIANEFYNRTPKASCQPARLVDAYTRAELLRRERLLLTFDDMLFDGVELLRDQEDVRTRWSSRYSYVLQDEAQDQNLSQLLMGELLSQDHRNYMLVGDPAQCIFSWRGARPEKLLNFEAHWNAKVVLMGRNYRCGSAIIEAANGVLDSMDPASRLPVQMICERTGVDGTIVAREYDNLDDEGESITSSISGMLADGLNPGQCAVLYRTNAQSRAPEEALIGARIPYRIIGGTNFYERREVRCLLSYLRIANGSGTLDDIQNCLNAPFRFLGKKFVDRVKTEAERRGLDGPGVSWSRLVGEVADQEGIQRRQRYSVGDWGSLIDTMQARIAQGKLANSGSDAKTNSMPARILEDIVMMTRYAEWLIKDEGEESPENSRVSNVREMVRAAARFTSVEELLEYVDRTIANSRKQRKDDRDADKVTLCSIHRAKGMEWPAVFVVGASQGILPHARAEEPEEERRLFYVAVTRARDYLHIGCPINIAMGKRVFYTEPSEFLGAAGLVAEPRRPPPATEAATEEELPY